MAKETPLAKSTPEQTIQTATEQTVQPASVNTASDITEVVLIAAHEHGGELKQPGDSIRINSRQQDWLRSLGKIK